MSVFTRLQDLLPQHALSYLLGALSDIRGGPLTRAAVAAFVRTYGVDLGEAERARIEDYASFNDFFTRRLRTGARPLAADVSAAVSPADGTLGTCGTLRDGELVQAKGHRYPAARLLADGDLARRLEGGVFCTVYLSPRDYHRVHAPLAGRLTRADYVPGRLFSVNAATEAARPGLFAENERLVCRFDGERGPWALVLVGALIVAGIRSIWGDPRVPARGQAFVASRSPLPFARGDEVGHFRLGSTVIVCLPPGAFAAPSLPAGSSVRVGEALARATPGGP